MLNLNLQLRRGDFALDVDASLDGDATGVFGRCGAGKTTLLHCISGLLTPDAGRVVLDGITLFDSRRRIHVPPHKRRIGVVFQDGRLLPHYSVRGNLLFGRSQTPRGLRRFDLADVTGLLGLEELLDRGVGELSGGERQRVALGRAILSSPRLLLLDEPLASLDAQHKREILPFLWRVKRATGIPIVMVSHNLAEILCLTHDLLLLLGGRVQACGRYGDLLRAPGSLDHLHAAGTVNALRCVTAGQDARGGMMLLTPLDDDGRPVFRQGRPVVLKGPRQRDVPPGTEARVILDAQDVALALGPVEYISMQNQLSGRIVRLSRCCGRTLCLVDVGIPLVAEVTDGAVADLELAEGKRVWCLFKTHSLDFASLGPVPMETPPILPRDKAVHEDRRLPMKNMRSSL